MTTLTVRALTPEDDRSGFTCGDIDLDRFFQRFAGQNQFKHHVGVTYIATDETTIHGFLTVSASSIETTDLPERWRKALPRYPLPVLRIARLAAAEAAKGMGVGRLLLRYALELALRMADDLGCVGVVVDAKEQAVSYYERYGFEAFAVVEGGSNARPMPLPMFLSLGSIPRGA